MMVRRLFLIGFTAALLAAFGCASNTGEDSVAFRCTDGGAAAENAVNLSCGGATGGTTEKVDVVLGGPASGTTTLLGLDFDVTYVPTRVEFVPAASYTSPLFPDALIAVTLADGLPGRVVVSVRNTGGDLESVGAGQHEVITLSFRRLPGIEFHPTPLAFDNAEAAGATPAISFTTGLSLSYE